MANCNEFVAIFRGAFTAAWGSAPQETKDEVTQHWAELHSEWTDMGAELLATLDDTYTRIGLPGGSKQWSFYEVWAVSDFEMVKSILDSYRPEDGTLRLDKYFRIEVVVGPRIPDLERAAEDN